MIILIRDAKREGFNLHASAEISAHFASLAQQHGLSLEETVRRALVPSICAAFRAPVRSNETIDALVSQKVAEFKTHQPFA